jgi:hypothetical protein
MAIDLILWAPDKATLATFAKSNPPANPLMQDVDDGEGGTITVTRDGVSYCWWAGSGKMLTQLGTYDSEGNELTPPQYLTGVVALLRIHSDFFNQTRLNPDPEDPDAAEQWARSTVAKYIKDNGTPGTVAGGTIPYYELGGIRIFRPTDVEQFLSNNNLPGHIWVGGNSY